MNAFLSQREIARRASKPRSTMNSEPAPISGYLIALATVAILAFAVGSGLHVVIAGIIS